MNKVARALKDPYERLRRQPLISEFPPWCALIQKKALDG